MVAQHRRMAVDAERQHAEHGRGHDAEAAAARDRCGVRRALVGMVEQQPPPRDAIRDRRREARHHGAIQENPEDHDAAGCPPLRGDTAGPPLAAAGAEPSHKTRGGAPATSPTSALPRCPGPNGAIVKPDGTNGSSSRVPLPPQHWPSAGPSDKLSSRASATPSRSIARASSVAFSSRCPPPIEPLWLKIVTTSLVPLSRGAEPLMSASVTSTHGSPRAFRAPIAHSQSF